MQTQSKYLLFLSLSLTLGACKKFLNVQPVDSVSDQATIVDATSAQTAVRGVYRTMAGPASVSSATGTTTAQGYYGGDFEQLATNAADNVQWTGSHTTDQQFITQNVTSDNGNLELAWQAIYATINGANQVIAKVPLVTDATLTQTLRNQLTGEGYFLRALSYFDLARTWGGVPITLTPTTSATQKNGIKRSSLADTYAQVLSDLNAADSLMSLPTTANPQRANKETAWALKARYYLYQQDWANAEAYATKVLGDSTKYQLLKPFSTWFQPASAIATRESVFELEYSVTYTNSNRSNWQPPANGGTRQWAPSDAIVTLLNDPTIGGGRSALIAKTSTGLWYGNLFYRSPATDPSYIIRIAEVYLIRAEARAEQNNLAGALADLNAIRSRAGVAASTASSQADVLLAIENENRVEFAQEPHRWFDLVRTGRAQTVLGITDPNKLVFPIPLNEITLSNGSLTQNAGY
jgi:hypothetical protein